MLSVRRSRSLVPAILVVLASPLAGQGRVMDYTGMPDGRIEGPFSQVVGVQPMGGGKVLVSDLIDGTVQLINFSSRARVPVGRQGGGPGEWQVPFRITAGPNGSAYLIDGGKQVVHMISSEGEITRSIPWPVLPGEPVRSAPMGGDGKGGIFLRGSGFGGGGQGDSIPLGRWDPASGRVVKIAEIANPRGVREVAVSNGQMDLRRGGKPFDTRPEWVGLPDGGVAMVHPDPYRVDRIDQGGVVSRGTTVSVDPVRVTQAERNAWREAHADQAVQGVSVSRGLVRGSAPTPEVDDSDFPATLPPFVANAKVVPDPEGNVWVQRASPATAPFRTWDIIRPGGGRVGVARLRADVVLAAIDASHLYAIRTDDETGLQSLERYRR